MLDDGQEDDAAQILSLLQSAEMFLSQADVSQTGTPAGGQQQDHPLPVGSSNQGGIQDLSPVPEPEARVWDRGGSYVSSMLGIL